MLLWLKGKEFNFLAKQNTAYASPDCLFDRCYNQFFLRSYPDGLPEQR
jgi:hypothetical protein